VPALPRFGSKVNIQINARTLPTNHFPPNSSTTCFLPLRSIPNPLLAQLLVAATFPDQVEEAPRDACRSDGGPALRMTALRKSR
jgi:hypothetical protein